LLKLIATSESTATDICDAIRNFDSSNIARRECVISYTRHTIADAYISKPGATSESIVPDICDAIWNFNIGNIAR
jgi:hypothetical protein